MTKYNEAKLVTAKLKTSNQSICITEDLAIYLKMVVTKLKQIYGVPSLKELGKKINISNGTLSKLSKVGSVVSKKTIATLCFYSGVNIDIENKDYTEVTQDEYQDKYGRKVIGGVVYDLRKFDKKQ